MTNPTRSLFHRPGATLSRVLSAGTFAFALALGGVAYAEPEADKTTVTNVELRDGRDQPEKLPSFGKKVLLILYTDPDEADQNDKFADAVKAKGFPQDVYQSIGIANMKDAPAKPDWAIRMVVRKKVKKYGVTILTDPNYLLRDAWQLGDCNNKSVVIVVDQSGKIKYFKKGALSDSEINSTLDLLTKLTSEATKPAQ